MMKRVPNLPMLKQVIVIVAAMSSSIAMRASEPTPAYDNACESWASAVPYLYGHLPELMSRVAPDGAMGINQLYEAHKMDHWRIEEARTADNLVFGGVALHNTAYIDAALRAFDWGFAHQGPDGNFPGTNDAFHSTSFFVEAAAHSLFCLSLSPYSKHYEKQINEDRPKIERAAKWLTSDAVWGPGVEGNLPYGHRRFLVSAALAFASLYTGDNSFELKAHELLEKALAMQSPEGFNPEKGGYDTNYNALGLVFAQGWILNLPQDSLTPRLEAMLERGMAWEATMILPSGEINSKGNTRTGVGLEKTLDGKPKIMQKTSTLRAFVIYDSSRATSKYASLVKKIYDYYTALNM